MRESKSLKALGKGYSVLTSLILLGFLSLYAVDLKVEVKDSRHHVTLQTKSIPPDLLIPSAVAIFSLLGLDTDSLAERIGKFISSKDEKSLPPK